MFCRAPRTRAWIWDPRPEPPPSVAAIEPDPTEPLVLRELAHGDLEGPGFFVEAQAVDYNLRVTRAARWFNGVAAASCARRPLPRPFRLLAASSTSAKTSSSTTTSSTAAPRCGALAPQVGARAGGPAPADQEGRRVDRRGRLETGETIFERNAAAPETIASVTKMISTAAALHYLGPDVQVPDDLLAAGRDPRRQPDGSLLVVGRRGPQHLRAVLRRRLVRDFRQVGRGPAAGRDPASRRAIWC